MDFHKRKIIIVIATGTDWGLTGHIVNSPNPKEHFLNRSRNDSDSDCEKAPVIRKTTLPKLSKAFQSYDTHWAIIVAVGLENEKMVLVGYIILTLFLLVPVLTSYLSTLKMETGHRE
jgi:hypothetical protein